MGGEGSVAYYSISIVYCAIHIVLDTQDRSGNKNTSEMNETLLVFDRLHLNKTLARVTWDETNFIILIGFNRIRNEKKLKMDWGRRCYFSLAHPHVPEPRVYGKRTLKAFNVASVDT